MVVIVKDIEIVKDKVRADDTRVKIAEVLVGDETGCVIFKAKNGESSQTNLQYLLHR